MNASLESKPCLYCRKETATKYPAFHWDGQVSYRHPNSFIYVHKDCYRSWYNELIAGLANLDEVMNYCSYFERTNGNIGNYVRDGKSYPVNGTWDGYYINSTVPLEAKEGDFCYGIEGFKSFLKENGWTNGWFKLREKYIELLVNSK